MKPLLGLRVAALVVCSLIAACSPPPPVDSEEVPASLITQEIGPEGGEIVAPDDSALAGVRLRVPKGALTAKVKISLDGTLEPTPLANTAEQVGPQIAIGPSDVVFASPAELTVPLEPAAVVRNEHAPEDCKVWYRTDGSWQRLERKAGTASSVTVDLPAAGVAAAGVISISKPLTCLTKPALCRFVPKGPSPTGCHDPSGYCLQKLPQPTFAPLTNTPEFVIANRKLYYAHSPATGKISVARYDLETGTSVLLGTLNVGGFIATSRSPIAIEADGSAWLGLREFGNVKFKEGALPLQFDRGTENGSTKRGEGAVVVGNTTIRMFTVSGDLFITDGSTRKIFPAPSFHHDFTLLPAKGVAGKFVAWNANAVFRLGFNDTEATSVLEIPGDSLEVASSFKSSGVASVFVGNDNAANATKWQTATHGLLDFDSDNRMTALDGDDNLYAATTTIPEIRFFTEEGGFGVIPLTDAVSPSPEFFRMQPRAVLGVSSRREVVVVVNGATSTSTPLGVRELWLLQQAD